MIDLLVMTVFHNDSCGRAAVGWDIQSARDSKASSGMRSGRTKAAQPFKQGMRATQERRMILHRPEDHLFRDTTQN